MRPIHKTFSRRNALSAKNDTCEHPIWFPKWERLNKAISMTSDFKLEKAAQKSLQVRLSASKNLDSKGYVSDPQQNLLPGVLLQNFEADLREGAGNELRMKFCAAHSSAALPVNCFAWFRSNDRLQHLAVLGHTDSKTLKFERKCPIFGVVGAPNLDVWIEYEGSVIAIESKLTEYFKKTKPAFQPAYDKLAPPELSESIWWDVYLDAKKGVASYLDHAQLVKHYFGLRRYQQKQKDAKRIVLLYLYWEPTNASDIEVCRKHREEVAHLKEAVSNSKITFDAMSYSQLWSQWNDVPELQEHAANLRARYHVAIEHEGPDR